MTDIERYSCGSCRHFKNKRAYSGTCELVTKQIRPYDGAKASWDSCPAWQKCLQNVRDVRGTIEVERLKDKQR